VKRSQLETESKADAIELRNLLDYYLYPRMPEKNPIEPAVPLVPPMSDRFGPLDRKWSGSGKLVASSYIDTFHLPDDPEREQPTIIVQKDDAPLLIASHLTNAAARQYFGNPDSRVPYHQIRCHDQNGEGGYEAELRWAIYSPENAPVKRKWELFQGKPMIRVEPVHKVDDLQSALAPVRFASEGDADRQIDDYLLITVLPRDSREDRRVISLAGLHKPGTLAASKLLREDRLSGLTLTMLRELSEWIPEYRYYQALISVQVRHLPDRTPVPGKLKLIAATGVDVHLFGTTLHAHEAK